MASVKDCAIISHLVYKDGEIDSEDWKAEGEIISLATGFQGGVYIHKDTKERVVAYRGSDETVDYVVDDRLNKFNYIQPQAISAMMLFEMAASNEKISTESYYKFFSKNKASFIGDIYNWYEGNWKVNMMVTGHSLGGSLASIVANKYGTRAVVFGSLKFVGLRNTKGIMRYYPDFRPILEENGYDEDQVRNAFKGQEMKHVIEIIDMYEQGDFEIKKSPNIDANLSYYYTDKDLLSGARYTAGKSYEVSADYSLFNGMVDPHTIRQWTWVDRYDANGNFDITKDINISESQRAILETMENPFARPE